MIFSAKKSRTILGLGLGIVFVFAANVLAHDGLHEQIIAVTKEIAKDPNNANLYLKRAELYRLHEEWKNSEKDYNRAEK